MLTYLAAAVVLGLLCLGWAAVQVWAGPLRGGCGACHDDCGGDREGCPLPPAALRSETNERSARWS